MSQNEIGIEAFAITVPFLSNESQKKIEVIDNVRYYRSNVESSSKNEISDQYKSFFKRFKKVFKINKFIFQLYKLSKFQKPDVLHAHAMFFCGISSVIVGKILKIPVFYEVRSLWMLPKDSLYKTFIHKLSTKLVLKIELFTMRLSKKVFVINENLKDQLIDLGIKKEKLVVIKNAVNTTLISKNLSKIKEGFVRDQITLGYIGSITPYEGIPFMLRALQIINNNEKKIKLIIYGSVREAKELEVIKEKIKEYSLDRYVEYKGSINPSEVYKAYQEIDVIVNPRLKNKITDTVTPLKPLEAMAYKKIFIGSDVGGIKDLLSNCDHGFLFKSDKIESLIEVIDQVSKLSQEERKIIGENARKFVINEKSWVRNAELYKKEYSKFLNLN